MLLARTVNSNSKELDLFAEIELKLELDIFAELELELEFESQNFVEIDYVACRITYCNRFNKSFCKQQPPFVSHHNNVQGVSYQHDATKYTGCPQSL